MFISSYSSYPFCMVLGSAPYFLNTMIMLKPLDNMVEKSKAKKARPQRRC